MEKKKNFVHVSSSNLSIYTQTQSHVYMCACIDLYLKILTIHLNYMGLLC